MMRTPKSRFEIEKLVLHELKEWGGCEGAMGISVVSYEESIEDDNSAGEPNWTVSAFNAGTADDYACERALMKIVPRLQGFYKLVQKH